MIRQELIQFTKTFIIHGQADVQQLLIPAELNSRDGPDPILSAGLHKIDDTGGIVDIGECKNGDAACLCRFHQFFNGKGAVTQGII